MMNINSLLLEEVESCLWKYDCNTDEIRALLFHQGSFRDRQEKAITVIGGVLEPHGKKQLRSHVTERARASQCFFRLYFFL